jgi:hypothetical protein
MHAAHLDPIAADWTTIVTLPSDARPVTVATLAARLGELDPAELEGWSAGISVVCAELAELAGVAWWWDAATPPVVLQRAVGRLALAAPRVASPAVGSLLAALPRPGG